MARVGREAKALDRAMGGAGSATDRADRALDRAAAAATGASTSFSRLQRVASTAGRAMRGLGNMSMTAFSVAGRGARSLIGHLTSIQSLLIGAGAGYVGIFRPLQLASEAEQADIAFTTMLGSAERAASFIADLEQFAKDTPFDVPQMRDNARMLMAFGFEAERILPMMTALGNASSGLGMGAEGIERMARALGQIRAKGRLQGEESLQLMEAGIPVLEIMAEATGLSTAAIQDEMSKGLIPAEAAINILIDGMNRRFPDMMDKQAESLAGLWAQITETFETDILRAWGQGIAEEIRPRLAALSGWIDRNGDTIARWGSVLRQTAGQATDWLVSRFERAFNLIGERYINNPEFRDLSIEGKIDFIFTDVMNLFNEWYDKTGRDVMADISEKVTSMLASGLQTAAPKIASAAIDIGKAVGSGILEGLMQWADENPIIAGLLGAVTGAKLGSRFGPTGLVGGAILGGGTAALGIDVAETIDDAVVTRRVARGVDVDSLQDAEIRIRSHEGPEPVYGYGEISVPPDKRRKRGLDYVPYDGYIAMLHRGESVLTAPEAREYRGDSVGNGTTINFGDIIVNSNGGGSERYDAMKLLREINRLMSPLVPN